MRSQLTQTHDSRLTELKEILEILFQEKKRTKQKTCPPAKEVTEFYIMAQQPTINTQANCQQLIMSHSSQDGADEAILPIVSVWPPQAISPLL